MALIVFVLAFGFTAPFATQAAPTYDGFIMSQVAIALAEDGTPLIHPIDRFGLNTPYSGYGIASSALMAALIKAADAVGADWQHAMRLVNPLLYAATIAGLASLLRGRGHSVRMIGFVTALFAIGTPLIHYALVDFSEPGVALMVILALLGIEAVEKGSSAAAVGVGAAVGVAALFRADSWLLVAPPITVALWWLGGRSLRVLVLAAVGVAPPAALWMAYNAARFDAPFTSGYGNQTFDNPLLEGLYGLTLSPGRGLFIYVPLVALGIALVPRLEGSARVFGIVAVSMLALRLLLYSRWWSWYGGGSWGPRFMVPMLPAFGPVIADAFTRWPRRAALHVAAGATAAMGVIGFLVAIDVLPFVYGQPSYDFSELDRLPVSERAAVVVRDWTSDEYLDATTDVMFDWGRFPTRRP
jgi:hypothetical protein